MAFNDSVLTTNHHFTGGNRGSGRELTCPGSEPGSQQLGPMCPHSLASPLSPERELAGAGSVPILALPHMVWRPQPGLGMPCFSVSP